MNGCATCGGFGDRHDPIAHDWPRESNPAPDPTAEEQARIQEFGIFAEEEPRCGMRKPGSTATCIEPSGHAGPDGRSRSHGDGSVIRWIYR